MWSILEARSLGLMSTRRISHFFLAIVMALLGVLAFSDTTVRAQSINDSEVRVVWSGENLTYDGITLSKSASPREDNNLPTLDSSRCQGTVFYSPVRDAQSPSVNENADNQYYWLSVICLEAGDDGSDKSQPSDAFLFEYRTQRDAFNPATDSRREFTEASPVQIVIPALGTDTAGGENEGTTSCDSTYTNGLGWIICPVTNFLADGMDWLYEEVLTKFLVVQPISTDQDNALYRAWGFMRNLANVMFVIGFLVLIYSQITTLGLSNYGVKRMLPRLIIAAILVNVSYWLSAIAIDLSNITGGALQDMFYAMRNGLVGADGNSFNIPKWQETTTYILSGGAVLGGLAAVGLAIGAGTVGAAVLGLVPILMIAIMSVLIAVLVMAARQAIITILVILSPLACVAFLLPNTEKYFERWRDLFITMLMVFPMFSVIFGGSQLAATAIIQNADNIITVLLGMAVQVAPLAVTPLLIKLSGSLIGRIAGMVNNPNRGLVDRTRKFTDERAQLRRGEAMARNTEAGPNGEGFRRNNLGARLARNLEKGKRSRAGYQKAYENNVDAWFATTKDSHVAHDMVNVAHLRKEVGEKEAEAMFNRRVQTNEGLRRLETQSRVNTQEANYTKTVNDNAYERMKADPSVETSLGDLALRAQTLTNNEKTQANRLNTAQRVQNSNYADEMLRNAALQAEAGDSRIDEYAAQRVKTAAQAQETSAYQERIKNYRTSFGYENIAEDDALELALGRDAADYEVNPELQEAAVEHIIGLGHVETFIKLQKGLDLRRPADPTAPDPNRSLRQTYAAAMKSSPMKPKFIPTSALTDEIPQGLDPAEADNYGQDLINKWVGRAVMANKYDATSLNKTDPDDIVNLRVILSADPSTGAPSEVLTRLMSTTEGQAAIRRQKESIRRNFKDEQLYRDIGNRLKPIRELGELLGMDTADLEPDPPRTP